MMTLFLQMLKKNTVDYSLVLICGTTIVSIVYFASALAGCMNQITTGSAGDFTKIYGSLGVFILTFVLLFLLMGLVLLDYIRKRSYTYALLTLLGMKKKHKYLFVALEYVGIILCSIVVGVLLGILEAALLKKGLYFLFQDFDGVFDYGDIPFKLTLIIAMVGFGLLFIICDEIILCFGIDVLIDFGQKQGKSFRKSFVLTGIGTGLLLIGCFSQFTYWGKISKLFPIIFASVGLMLLMWTLVGALLLNNQGKTKKYYKKILWLNNWYHRYYYNVNMAYIAAVFLFVMVYMFGMKVLDNYPISSEKEFCYDLVWMANKEDEEFLKELEMEHDVEISTQECIRVTTPDFGEHVGVSVSEYKKWTGEEIKLSEDEIYVVYQRNKEERSELGIDYGAPYPRLHMGNANPSLWVKTGKAGVIPSAKFKKYHHVKGEKTEIITGIFESSSREQYYGKVWEAIIVFSDVYYERVKESVNGADLVVMMDIPNDYEEVTTKVYAYAKEHSQVDWLDEKGRNLYVSFTTPQYHKGRNLVYETDVLLKEDEKTKLFKIVSSGINCFVLFICVLFTLYIKQRCDYGELEWKYGFYNHFGMSLQRRKKYIKKEVTLTGSISLIGGIVLSLIFIVVNIMVKRPGFEDVILYAVGLSCIYLSFIFVIWVFGWILARKSFTNIERRNKNV